MKKYTLILMSVLLLGVSKRIFAESAPLQECRDVRLQIRVSDFTQTGPANAQVLIQRNLPGAKIEKTLLNCDIIDDPHDRVQLACAGYNLAHEYFSFRLHRQGCGPTLLGLISLNGNSEPVTIDDITPMQCH